MVFGRKRPIYYPICCHAAWIIHILLIRLLAEICFTEQDARMSTTCSVGSMIFEALLGKSSKNWYSISVHCMRAVVSMAPFGTHRKAV